MSLLKKQRIIRNKKIESLVIFTIVSFLCIFGLIMVYSSSYVGIDVSEGEVTSPFYFLFRQILGIFFGVFIAMFFYKLPKYSKINRNIFINLFFIFSVSLLIFLYFFGNAINGSIRWIQIGFLNIQPSEILKISMILLISNLLTKKKFNNIFYFFVFFIVLSLIAYSNLSSSLLIVISIFSIILFKGIKIKDFSIILFIISFFSGIFLIMKPYRILRLKNFFIILKNPLKASYQAKQSLYALANGGIFGRGITNSIQKFYYLPEHHTDFIFSIIGEELGLAGEFIIISLYFLLICFIFKIIINLEDLFLKYSCLGFSIILISQTILNIGVVSSLFPTTGVTLPFISYGGSSLMVSLVMIGFILGSDKFGRIKNE